MKAIFEHTSTNFLTEQQVAWLVDQSDPSPLADSERLRLAMEAGRFGTFTITVVTGEMECNLQCRVIFGQDPETPFRYDALLSLVHDEDRPVLLCAFETATRDGSYYDVEFRIRLDNGEIRWVLVRGKVTYNRDRTPLQIVAVIQDVTKQRQSEEALRISEASVKEREWRIRSLYALTSRTDIGFTEKVDQLLQAGHDWLGLDAGILASIDCSAGIYTIAQIAAVNEAFQKGFACPLETTYCSETIKFGVDSPPLAFEHAGSLTQWQDHPAYKAFGCEAYLGAVIRVSEGRAWGSLSFFSQKPRDVQFSEFDIDMARLMAQWIGGEIARQEAEEALRIGAAQQRRFVRQMLSSVTEGKLCLCDSPDDLPHTLMPVSEQIVLTSLTLRDLRYRVRTAAEALQFNPDRTHELVTAVGEAAMNAVRHGGGGTGRVYVDMEQKTVQVWLEDQGNGIREEDLHRATLEKGWSSAGSFGHGFYLMLRTVDRTFLLTSGKGTTVVLEQQSEPPQPDWF